jgi:hypothetical protein
MNAKWIQSRRSMLVGLLGATMLFGSPVSARADQGKWWDPERGARRSVMRQEAYRAPSWRNRGAYRQGPRYWRRWEGRRLYRERVWLRTDWSYRGRPAYGWRYYWAPSYYYPRHIVYVRPVRFFISAGATIGGVHVHGDYADYDDIYGCNFCDAQFSSFHAYEAHLAHCAYAPRGFTIVVADWDHGQWDEGRCQDDRGWDREDDD